MKKTLLLLALCAPAVQAAEITAKYVANAFKDGLDVKAAYWAQAPEAMVTLMAQPMTAPRPMATTTDSVRVKAVNDGRQVAFLLKWKDSEQSQAGRLGEFSDAVALEFPVKDNKNPPPVFMGAKDNPVHIYHWRAQYQHDETAGKPRMEDLYPNMNTDMYPMEFKDAGNLKDLTDANREQFLPAVALGNPQSYSKTGVDEVLAEGFGSSSVHKASGASGQGEWKDGEWSVIISRALANEGGSVVMPGKDNVVSFAIWQGGSDEVGSRKSVSMEWHPLNLEGAK